MRRHLVPAAALVASAGLAGCVVPAPVHVPYPAPVPIWLGLGFVVLVEALVALAAAGLLALAGAASRPLLRAAAALGVLGGGILLALGFAFMAAVPLLAGLLASVLGLVAWGRRERGPGLPEPPEAALRQGVR